MSYLIKYNSDKNIVSIEVDGKLSISIVHQYCAEGLKLAHQNSCHRFLINHLSTELHQEHFNLHTDGAALEQFGFKNTDKVAIVAPLKKEDIHFSEKHESDINWCEFKYFNSIDESLEWLDKGI